MSSPCLLLLNTSPCVGRDNGEELLLLAIMGMLSRNRCHRLIDALEVYTLEGYGDFVEADRYIFQKIKDLFDI